MTILPEADSLGHRTRFSDSSMYDEKCVLCGGTDGAGDNSLRYPCPKATDADERAHKNRLLVAPTVAQKLTEYAADSRCLSPHLISLLNEAADIITNEVVKKTKVDLTIKVDADDAIKKAAGFSAWFDINRHISLAKKDCISVKVYEAARHLYEREYNRTRISYMPPWFEAPRSVRLPYYNRAAAELGVEVEDHGEQD